MASKPWPPDDPKEARAAIDRMHAQLDGLDHFELLGVDPGTPPPEVKAAYVTLARKWHPDTFGHLRLQEASMSKAQATFKAVNEAYAVLSDPDARAEYVTKLERERRGMSTDVDAILRAEAKIDEGLALLGNKRWGEAEQAFREAIDLNKDQPLTWVYHAWARYRRMGSTPEALVSVRKIFERALAVQENLPEAYFYLGQMYFQQDDLQRAIPLFQRCVERAPDNVDAQRLLRLARSRAEKNKAKPGLRGLLDKLLKK